MAEPDFPLALPIVQPAYPTLQFFARRGHVVAVVVAAAIVAAGLIAWFAGMGWGWIPLALAIAAAAYLLLRCLGELVHLIADAMIPK
jgi:hypothetical protein